MFISSDERRGAPTPSGVPHTPPTLSSGTTIDIDINFNILYKLIN